jgi:SPP1 gp7 family putative phage head morphogenesis protein
MATSEALIESTVRHQVYLERLKSGEVNQFASFLKRIDQDLRKRLSNPEITDFTRSRMERLLKSIDESLQAVFSNYYDELAGHLTDIAEYEAEFEARNLANAATDKALFESVIPATNQVHAAIFSAPLSVRGADGGKLLEPFIKDWSSNEAKRITGVIRQGFFEGQTNSQMIQAVRGTRANGFRDGVLATTSRNAEAIVRTAVQHVASVSRSETWKANSDIVKGYRWVSTLDGRTSNICRSLDGKVFKQGKGPMPPVHIRCRSTTVAELDKRFGFLKEGRTRASKDGPVDADLSYYEWLKQQSPDFQDDVIGPARGNLFRNGGLNAERFAKLNLGRNFKPMTLAEMRKKEPLAFSKAQKAL